MKSLFSLGLLFAVLSFCGLTDRITETVKQVKRDSGTAEQNGATTTPSSGVEQAKLSAKHEEILAGGSEAKWAEQGITWTLPKGWKQMNSSKSTINYGSPATGFLIGTIATMSADFPSQISLDATHTSSLEQLKNGRYESVRLLEIDGIKGVEWVEAMPEEKTSPRRHQWIGFRNYQGQNQQLNIMVTTQGDKFDAKRDNFAAIMYSMKIDK